MKSNKSAVRYATALLELAIEHNKVELIEADILQLLKTAEEVHEIAILHQIFKDFNQTTLDFLSLVANNGRESIMVFIANQFMSLLKAHRGIVPITIISAQQLEDSTKASILSQISASIKGTAEITEKIDADLIGGFIVRMGDHQIDASVASQLKRLKQQFV
jgi:F-type H+-transporting ATPase subunit delta